MKIEVYNLNKILYNVEKFGKKGISQNVISIRDKYHGDDTAEKYAALDRRFSRYGVNSIVVEFDDIDPYRFKYGMEHPFVKAKFADGTRQPIFFDSEFAKRIVSWVKDLWDKDHNVTIKIHCWAGRSRSQAVAYWLNIYFNLVLEHNMDDYVSNNALNLNEKVHLNCEVLRVFSSTFG